MKTTGRKPRVALLIGGVSGEHSISCLTAAGVLRNIDLERFDVLVIGITRSGHWVLVPAEPEALEGGHAEVRADAPGVTLVKDAANEVRLIGTNGTHADFGVVDVILPLLHGPFGEDGTVQGMFEMLGVRYVGSGVLASAAGMDKHMTKVVLQQAGLPVGNYVAVTPAAWQRDRESVLAQCAKLASPLFVKPARAGSSLGITKVDDITELAAAIETAHEHDPKVIVEEGVTAREIEVAVLAGRDGRPRVAPVGEVVMDLAPDEFYDWETKYFSHDAVSMQAPAQLPEDVAQSIADYAAATFEALECEGLARVDFFYTDSGEILVNEINTMPGMTPYSMYPYMWQQAGLSYRELVTELIELALARPVGLR